MVPTNREIGSLQVHTGYLTFPLKKPDVKITLHCSVYMRTSGEKVRISDEAECVQSVSYSHIRSLSGLYTVVCLRKGKRGTCLGPPFATVMCKVAYLAFKGAQ